MTESQPPPSSPSSASSSRRSSLQTPPEESAPTIGENEYIPPLQSICASIFVPIPPNTDLLQPPPPPSDNNSHHDNQQAVLAVVNAHAASVRNNLQNLFRRELLRLTREAEAHEDSFDYLAATAAANRNHPYEDPMQREDLANMIANMRAPHEIGKDYNITDIPLPNFDSVPMAYSPINSPRENVTRELFKVIAAGTHDLIGFDNHVQAMRNEAMRQQPPTPPPPVLIPSQLSENQPENQPEKEAEQQEAD